MAYFITGGTGFIGRRLVARLAARGEPVYVLVRPGSRERFERLRAGCGAGAERLVAIEGDLEADLLGVAGARRAELKGRIRHFLHLGALYDLGAEAGPLERANVLGTRHALALAHELQAGCFHLVSSIAAAGRYPGTFTDTMFAEAEDLTHPYFRTKHESEALVRRTCRVPWRIYRPGMVIGDSRSGEMDKIDGPYYFFKLIQLIRDTLPRWLPLVGIEGGHINLVPVDFVAAAIDHIAHAPGEDGGCFHLVDRQDRRIGAVLNLFAAAAHAPTMSLRLDPLVLGRLAAAAGAGGAALRPAARILREAMSDLGVPLSVLELLDHPTVFDPGRAGQLLERAGIGVPPLEDYAWRLWDYWERRLDPMRPGSQRLSEVVRGKTVLITGGSSGIGRAAALTLAEAGARVLIVGRDAQKLAAVVDQIRGRGAHAGAYACDITAEGACEQMVAKLFADNERVDILINNAGHSIRRAIEHTYDRFHDYERLMRVNFFGAVRLTLALLPSMVARGAGHVICISSISVLTSAARFAAYNASKAALEAFTRCAAAEYRDRGIRFTVVNMPLVRTAMVAPTRIYERFPLLEPEQAAAIICDAIVRRPERLATPLGRLAQLVEALLPGLNRAVMTESFRLFPESEAAGGSPGAEERVLPEVSALAALMRGAHR
ncbi:MAG TPA: SDR family oxidoreductase [Steroidobacteraceae bacterium]|nr:SDR family oxidoreductase [Steroidobacteraceae bacterium]